MNVRKLPDQEPRVESGAVQFGDDWRGLFLRGDDAVFFSIQLDVVLCMLPDPEKEKDVPLDVIVVRNYLSAMRDNIRREVVEGPDWHPLKRAVGKIKTPVVGLCEGCLHNLSHPMGAHFCNHGSCTVHSNTSINHFDVVRSDSMWPGHFKAVKDDDMRGTGVYECVECEHRKTVADIARLAGRARKMKP